MKKKLYSEDLDVLVALVSYLSFCQYKSMRPSRLSERLSLDAEHVINILDKYRGIFRKSYNKHNETGEHYYTLHMRYAQRWDENETDEPNAPVPPLAPEQFNSLMTFITNKASQEEGYKIERIKNWITMIAAIIAALAAIVGSIINALV